MNHDDEQADGGGFDIDDWQRLRPFTKAVATLDDVQTRRAVFALSDTAEHLLALGIRDKMLMQIVGALDANPPLLAESA